MSSNHPQDPPTPSVISRRQKHGIFSPELLNLIVPPLKVGTFTGLTGAFAGVGGAILRDTSPVASGFVSGVQWFALGTTYWFSRGVTIRAWGNEESLTPFDKVKISAIAGSATGAASGLLRGPTKILPAMMIWGTLGAGGQFIANRVGDRAKTPNNEQDGWFRSLSPLKRLTDEEYLNMMNEKILKVEVDIALIDDKITELKQTEKTPHEANASPNPEERR